VTVEQQLPVISPDTALELMGGPELFAEIGTMLLDELPELMGLIREHAANGELVELSKTAHRMKGNFGVIAAGQAQEAAKDLEYSSRDGDVATAEAALVALEVAVERVVPELERLITEFGG
jgi:HPt (histidine-containing phosphotransfer) domain-containing protein